MGIKRGLTSQHRSIQRNNKRTRSDRLVLKNVSETNTGSEREEHSLTIPLCLSRRVSGDVQSECRLPETLTARNGADSTASRETMTYPSSLFGWIENDGVMLSNIADQSLLHGRDTPQGMAVHCLESEESSNSLQALEVCDRMIAPDMPCDIEESLLNDQLECESSWANTKASVKGSSHRWRVYNWLVLVAVILGSKLYSLHPVKPSLELSRFLTSQKVVEKDSVCVSGGGFSGFWYIIGRLQTIPDPLEKSYYCYSAGCLGLVASFLNIAMEDIHDMAIDIQTRWKKGEISRFEVLPTFVDQMLQYTHDDNKNAPESEEFEFLGRLNVLTTVRNGWLGLRTSTRTPSSIQSLRTLLVQSAWIPFATGDGIFHHGHMDGAFFLPGHPRCEISVGLPVDIDIVANVVNMNLSADKVQQFWKLGSQSRL